MALQDWYDLQNSEFGSYGRSRMAAPSGTSSMLRRQTEAYSRAQRLLDRQARRGNIDAALGAIKLRNESIGAGINTSSLRSRDENLSSIASREQGLARSAQDNEMANAARRKAYRNYLGQTSDQKREANDAQNKAAAMGVDAPEATEPRTSREEYEAAERAGDVTSATNAPTTMEQNNQRDGVVEDLESGSKPEAPNWLDRDLNSALNSNIGAKAPNWLDRDLDGAIAPPAPPTPDQLIENARKAGEMSAYTGNKATPDELIADARANGEREARDENLSRLGLTPSRLGVGGSRLGVSEEGRKKRK